MAYGRKNRGYRKGGRGQYRSGARGSGSRRYGSRKRSYGSSDRTIRLVVEQAAPSPMAMVPNMASQMASKRSRF